MAQPISLDMEEERVSGRTNLVTLLRTRASQQPDRTAYTLLIEGEESGATLNYCGADLRARAIAATLQSLGASYERVLLLYPPGMDFVEGFFGSLYAGAIAVPTQIPATRSRNNQSLVRLQAILSDASPVAILSTSALLPKLKALAENRPGRDGINWIATDEISTGMAEHWRSPEIDPDALALLQYTSGSTASPKGVMVSHRNLLTNSEYIDFGFEHTSQSVALTWLPHSHDMGLINGIIQPLYKGFHCFIMPPAAFIQSPYRWLKAISKYRVTHSGGPNFAYELCLRKISDEQRAQLDLSCWEVAFNGAEPVRKQTLEEFAEAFAPCGFQPEAFYPAYGLAEATLKVTGGRRMSGPVFITLDAAALEKNRFSVCPAGQPKARTLVGAGSPGCGAEIVITDPHSKARCAPDEIGEIWVSGPGIAQGYWNREAETKEVFRAFLEDTGEGPFLRTGDLGFVRDGELFITGRIKDMIIIRGVNHYPQDLELSVERSHPALRRGGAAAFALDSDGREQLVVAQEVDLRDSTDLDQVIDSIRRALAEDHEVQPHAIALIKPGSLPKTTSGKIQRRLCRAMYLESSLDALSIWQSAAAQQSEDWLAQPAPQRDEVSIADWLRSLLASKLGVSAESVDAAGPIMGFGLDSLDAIQLMHHIQSTLGVGLSFSDFLESPSISQLATRMWDHLNSGGLSPIISADAKEGDFPLSAGQQSLWFLQQVAPQSPAYNIAAAVRIVSEVDPKALREAFQVLTDRHAMLRTTFSASQGEPFQRVHKEYAVCFEAEDALSWTDIELTERLREEAGIPFDLEQGPPFKVKLFSRSDRENVLSLVVHHIVADLWSVALLLEELGQVYSSICSGEKPQLEAARFHYTDYVRWESERLAGPEGDRLRTYWRRQLSGAATTLDLPSDKPRPKFQSFKGNSLVFKIDSELTGKLRGLAREQGGTLYMALMAAFQVLLHRYTAQSDFVIGSPTSGRSRLETADVLGYFVNPLVIRAEVSGAESFTDLLQRTRHTVMEALDHDAYPFPLLVKQLEPERDTSRSPVFQVLFVLQRSNLLARERLAPFLMGTEGSSMKLGDLSLESLAIEKRVAQFDLSLSLAATGDAMLGSLEYCTDLFEPSSIQRMAGHFEMLLRSIVADPYLPVSRLKLLSEPEERLFSQWASTSTDHRQSEILSVLFESQVDRTPEAVAVAFGDQELTYDELNRRANKLAHRLTEIGVGRDVLVGVLMERSVEMVVGLLGILKAGGAYVPLDPLYPGERLSFMLEDAQLRTVLTQQRFADRLRLSGVQALSLDSDWHMLAEESEGNFETRAYADNLAYVIYTSGSTGNPKGAMNSNRAICNRLCWMQAAYRLNESDRVLQKTPFTFDVSVWEFFWPLITGARLVMAMPGGHQDSAYLINLIAEQEITTLHFVPSMLHVFLENPKASGCRSLRRVICSGEALSVDLQNRFFSLIDSELHNLYGPTEAAVDVTFWRCDREGTRTRVPIGHPIANTQIHILDAEMQTVPVGVAGELHIAGIGLARGYLHRADLTADRFIPDPFSSEPGARMYKTGDLTRYLPGGEIEFLGRLDHQVKIRGFRIELGEVEAALGTHPAVSEVIVTAKEFGPGDTRLTAYVVPAQEHIPGMQAMPGSEGDRIESLPTCHLAQDAGRHRLPNGLVIAHDGEVQFNTMDIYREVFEKEVYLRHGITLSDGDCVFDVGAHIGLFSLFVDQRCKRARIYAFEPVPPTFEVLRANVSGRVKEAKLFNLGLADRASVDQFHYYPRMTGVSGRVTNPEEHKERRKPVLLKWLQSVTGGQPTPMLSERDINAILEEYFMSETYECRLTTLSDVIREHEVERIDLLKIDVEESEMDVLAGIRREDWERIKQIVVEVESKANLDNIVSLLLGHGYEVLVDNEDYGLPSDASVEQSPGAGVASMIYGIRNKPEPPQPMRPGTKSACKVLAAPESSPLAAERLRSHLAAKLPDYMVPSAFVLLDSLPLLSNGKVNLKALPAPTPSRQTLDQDYVAPRDEAEQALAAIFAEVLRVEKVGVNDNFFKMGGHSLLATKAMSRILDRLNVELPLQLLFERPTVAGIAEMIRESRGFRPEAIDPIVRINQSEEEILLAKLDELSDEEVEAFLKSMPADDGRQE